MANKTIDSKSKFNIYSSFTLSNDDVSVVSLLYAPLIGSDALMLYLAFSALLERNNLKSEEIIHQDLFDIYSFNSTSFMKARRKLEGIGLLMTYENENNYIYVLCPPLTAKNFIKDATLGLYLYSKIRQETFDFIYNHFKIEKIEKSKYRNITKSFDEVYESQIDNNRSFEKFQYILGRKASPSIKIKGGKFDFNRFLLEINKDFLETGVTKNFADQIVNLAFVYGFNEVEMVSLYNDSINKSGLYDYRLLKKRANVYFNYKRNMKAPILVEKASDNTPSNSDMIDYLENATPATILEDVVPGYPARYLDIVNDIYAELELPRGVLNCMILKVLKDKSGELPNANYFKKVSESWIRDNVFSTRDAIKYITTMHENEIKPSKENYDENGGFEPL